MNSLFPIFRLWNLFRISDFGFRISCLLALFFAFEAPAQVYRISATITVTNAPTTNGCSLTVNGDTRQWTNNPALNPGVWIQTNATKNGSATNLFQHLAVYRFATSINETWVDTNVIRIQASVGASLSVTLGGNWATNYYTTQLVSTPFTAPVRVPLTVETATNATNIASLLLDGLGTYTPTKIVTNGYNLGISNATQQPIFLRQSNSFLAFRSLEQGAGLALTPTPTSVVASLALGIITNLNGLTNQSQWFTATSTGTDFTITTRSGTTGGTNVFDLPFATNAVHGKLRSNDWSTFNLKQPASTLLTNLSATGAHTNAAVLLYRGPTNSGIGAPLILKAGTGISMATNNSTNFVVTCTLSPVGIPDFTNQVTRWFVCDAHTNLTGIGDFASTNGLNNASKALTTDGTSGPRVQWDGSGTVVWTNGFAGQKLYYATFNPAFAARVAVTNASDNHRAWIGFTDTTFGEMMESKTPTGLNVAAFRHWDDASDWYAVTSTAGTYEANDTGVAHDGNSHLFDIRLDATSAVFYIDGTPRYTNSTFVPQSSPAALRPIVVFKNITDGHDLQVEWVRLKSDR